MIGTRFSRGALGTFADLSTGFPKQNQSVIKKQHQWRCSGFTGIGLEPKRQV
jgi:hypothetical protein